MAQRSCSACRGTKKYWGAGMMHQYDCTYCDGTGKEEYEPNIVVEKPAEVVAEKSAEVVVEEAVKVAVKTNAKTIPVQPMMKSIATRKKK